MGTSSLSVGYDSRALIRDYVALLKPRVMTLVVFTFVVGFAVAPVPVDLFTLVMSTLCVTVGAGAAAALNMAYDADIDAIMKRTQKRPIPQGRVSIESANLFGVMLSLMSVAVMGLSVNWMAAGILAFSIFFYAVVYTMWLKRSTPQNIVIGGAAGAFPPMIGWVSATGSISVDAIALFMLTFLWTPPHFWALALYKTGDYGKAGIPMLPNVAGPAATRLQIWAYSILVLAVSLVPIFTGLADGMYRFAAPVLSGIFMILATKIWRSQAGEDPKDGQEASLYAVTQGNRAARNLFAYSILYLFAIYGALLFDYMGV